MPAHHKSFVHGVEAIGDGPVHIHTFVLGDEILPGSNSTLRHIVINLARQAGSVPGGQVVNSLPIAIGTQSTGGCKQ